MCISLRRLTEGYMMMIMLVRWLKIILPAQNPVLIPLQLSSNQHPANPRNIWAPPLFLVINLKNSSFISMLLSLLYNLSSQPCELQILNYIYDHKNMRYPLLINFSLNPPSEVSSKCAGPMNNKSHSTHPLNKVIKL